jgi:hypothetical protein
VNNSIYLILLIGRIAFAYISYSTQIKLILQNKNDFSGKSEERLSYLGEYNKQYYVIIIKSIM